MFSTAEDWFRRRTMTAQDWTYAQVIEAKRDSGLTVSLVLPALNEQETIGAIVRGAVELLDDALVDEVVVVDSRSTDATARIAREAGARVVSQEQAIPSLPRRRGKGDALYMGVAETSGDLVVFGDADVKDWKPQFVYGLLWPLLADPQTRLVKGFYDRPLGGPDGARDEEGGGRATEILVRPILNEQWPELSGVVQPLGGEYAARRELLERLWFPVGYGVEISSLLQTWRTSGLDSIAQVDLGRRTHSHQSTKALGRMAGEILEPVWRLLVEGAYRPQAKRTLVQFGREEGGMVVPREVDLHVEEREPLHTVEEYHRIQQGLRGGGRDGG